MLSRVQEHLHIRGPYRYEKGDETECCNSSRALYEQTNAAGNLERATDEYELERKWQNDRHDLRVRCRYHEVHDAGDYEKHGQ